MSLRTSRRPQVGSRRHRRALPLARPEMLEARRLLTLPPLSITPIDIPGVMPTEMFLFNNDSDQIRISYRVGEQSQTIVRTGGPNGTDSVTSNFFYESGFQFTSGINDSLQQVGWAYGGFSAGTGNTLAVYGRVFNPDGTMTIVEHIENQFAYAGAINDAGEVLLFYNSVIGYGWYRWNNGTLVELYEDQFVENYYTPYPFLTQGINDSGQYLFGIITHDPQTYEHLYPRSLLVGNGSFVEISVPGSYETVAQGLNDSGDVIGYYYRDAARTQKKGFLFRDGDYLTIEIAGGTNVNPTGINDAGDIVGSYIDASGQVRGFLAERFRPIRIDINDPNTDGDDVAILVPAEPTINRPSYAQRVEVVVTNTFSSEIEIELELLTGPGGSHGVVTIEQEELDPRRGPLQPGDSRTVYVTATQHSRVANDVILIARERGGERRELGRKEMTVVQVIPPTNVRAKNTPEGMPDRIPPRVETQVEVRLTPSLVAVNQSITLVFTAEGQGQGRGAVRFDSSGGLVGSLILRETTDLTIRGGDFQTEPGQAGRLILTTATTSGEEIGRSTGFSIVAIPVGAFGAFAADIAGIPFSRGGFSYGMEVGTLFVSDSEQPADLADIIIVEVVTWQDGSGVLATPVDEWARIAPLVSPHMMITDSHAIVLRGVPPAEGRNRFHQVHLFNDPRTGSGLLVIPNSGYEITHRYFLDNGNYRLETRKVGHSVDFGGEVVSAGASATAMQNIVCVSCSGPLAPTPNPGPPSPSPQLPRLPLPENPPSEPPVSHAPDPLRELPAPTRFLTGRMPASNLRFGPQHPSRAEWVVLGEGIRRLQARVERPDFQLRVDLGTGRNVVTVLIDAPGAVLHLTGGTRRDRVRVMLTAQARDARIVADPEGPTIAVRTLRGRDARFVADRERRPPLSPGGEGVSAPVRPGGRFVGLSALPGRGGRPRFFGGL